MSTIVLDYREHKALQPAHALWAQYQPENAPYRFSAQTPDEARQWQTATRAALAGTVGFQNRPAVPLAPRQIEENKNRRCVRPLALRVSDPGLGSQPPK